MNRETTWSALLLSLTLLLLGIEAYRLKSEYPIWKRQFEFWNKGFVRADSFTYYLPKRDNILRHSIVNTAGWEPLQSKLMQRYLKPGDTMIDIGAHIGYYTLLGSRAVGSGGKIVAFEPDPNTASFLAKNVKTNALNNVIIEPYALSNTAGELTLHVHPENTGDNSIVANGERNKEVTVKTIRLDDYLEKHPTDVALIKIDTQGAEGFITEGMLATLENNPDVKIILEFWPQELNKAGSDVSGLLDLFFSRGFHCFDIQESTGMVLPTDKKTLLREYGLPKSAYTNLLFLRLASSS